MAHLFVNNLSVIDFSYLDPARGIVGESWIVDLQLLGGLDEQGMVFDFGHIKKQVKHFIDTEVDHRLLVPVAASGCRTTRSHHQLLVEFPLLTGGLITHQSPADAVLLVDAATIAIHKIASDLQARIKTIMPDNVSDVVVHLRPEVIHGAYYHYTHGLQKHLGQCQRIAHGHRARIHVQRDGERRPDIEQQWAQRLKDSYIATDSHIVEHSQHNGIPHTHLAYRAQQGDFALSLPSAQIFTLPMESTVENLAHHFAECLAKEHKAKIVVTAYEGVDKGALGASNVS